LLVAIRARMGSALASRYTPEDVLRGARGACASAKVIAERRIS